MTTSTESYSREETVTDILLIRLPVKSLLRFRCKLLPAIVPSNQRIFRWEDVRDFRGILGPIDGLFLLQKGHFLCNVRFAWWNPATKECRIIPSLSFELQRYFDEHETAAGVGYDAVSKDYKVLLLRTYMNEEKRQVHPRAFAAVYSMNNDSWKHIAPNFPYENNLWPPIPNDHWGTLMMRGGSLAAMSCVEMAQPFTSCYDIWARIGENKWIKVISVNPPITWHWPLGIWEYDKYIYEMTQTYNLVYYNHTAKQTTDFGLVFTEIGSGSVWPISYYESLVPKNREKSTEEDNIDYFFIEF
ncbi:putative F-box protein-like [Capsicum annuum]|nr:putative F-box protein-like [Capsicum annuum]KAF3669624.1 putative F-box protein-like [Capsicum annuum]